MRNLKLSFQHREVTTMKQITNKEYEEWQKYKAEKVKGHVLLPVAAGSKGLSASVAEPCALPVNIGAEYLVDGQNRPPEVLAQQRIGNHLHTRAALAVVQRQTVAAIIVGAQPPD